MTLLLSRAQKKLIRSLHRRKGREAHGLFLVEGVRAVEACLDAHWPWRFAVLGPALDRTPRGAALRARLAASGAPAYEVARDEEFGGLAATERPQGVLLVAEWRPGRLEDWAPPPAAVLLVLEAVQDPGNVGTLLRAAHGLGAWAAAVTPGTADPWAPKAARAAGAALFHLPVARAALGAVLDWCRRHGFRILGADAEGEPLGRGEERGRRVALLLGNEGSGLTPAARAACDRVVAVPIAPTAESLNVAVAGALLLDRLRDA
jgi:TrmH family RNA methyltransferase